MRGHKIWDKSWEECGDVRSGREKCGAIKSVTKAGRSVGTSGLGQKLGGVWGRQVWGKSWEECGAIKSVTKAGRSVETSGLGQKLGGVWGHQVWDKS